MQRQSAGAFGLPDVGALVKQAISSNPTIAKVAQAATGIKSITTRLGTVKQDIIAQVQSTVKDQVQSSLSEAGVTPGSGENSANYGSSSNYGAEGGGRRKSSRRTKKKTRKMKRKMKRGIKRRYSR